MRCASSAPRPSGSPTSTSTSSSCRRGTSPSPTVLRALPERRARCSSAARSSATPAIGRRPDGLVTEAYTLASRDVPRVGRADILAKTIIRPRRDLARWASTRPTLSTRDREHGRASRHLEGRPGDREPDLREPPDEPLLHEVVGGVLGQARPGQHLDARVPAAGRARSTSPASPTTRSTAGCRGRRRSWRRCGRCSPSPYATAATWRLPDFPRSDQFGSRRRASSATRWPAWTEPRKQRAFDTLPMPGRARCRRRAPRTMATRRRQAASWARSTRSPGDAWLEGEIVWSLRPTAPPPLEGGSLDRPDERSAWRATVAGEDASLTIRRLRPPAPPARAPLRDGACPSRTTVRTSRRARSVTDPGTALAGAPARAGRGPTSASSRSTSDRARSRRVRVGHRGRAAIVRPARPRAHRLRRERERPAERGVRSSAAERPGCDRARPTPRGRAVSVVTRSRQRRRRAGPRATSSRGSRAAPRAPRPRRR